MPKSRRPYPLEYRERMIELVRSGRSPESLAHEFGPTAQCIRNWIRQADRDAGRRQDGLTTDERSELQHLRRENARLREEREILKNESRARRGLTCGPETPCRTLTDPGPWPSAFW
jgi:transposase